MILAGDIGGTKTILAYFVEDHGTLMPRLTQSYSSRQYKSLNEVLSLHLRHHPAEISSAAFGIAGPIVDGRSTLTNLGWNVDSRSIAAQLKLKEVQLLNDLAATAYGTLRIAEKDKVVLNPGTAEPCGAIAVIAAGTGLGEGGLVWNGSSYRAIPSEGGHTDFGPRTDVEIDLLRFLLGRHERVSYERIVSGPGMYTLYEFFRSRVTYPEPAWIRERLKSSDPSVVVSELGLEQKDEACRQALDLFVSLYGAETGNLALKFLSIGGVYIGGGIAPKLLSKIKEGSFMESFMRKGRYSSLLQAMPVVVILNEQTALYGAAHAAVMNNG